MDVDKAGGVYCTQLNGDGMCVTHMLICSIHTVTQTGCDTEPKVHTSFKVNLVMDILGCKSDSSTSGFHGLYFHFVRSHVCDLRHSTTTTSNSSYSRCHYLHQVIPQGEK